jgi:hypothetical protein
VNCLKTAHMMCVVVDGFVGILYMVVWCGRVGGGTIGPGNNGCYGCYADDCVELAETAWSACSACHTMIYSFGGLVSACCKPWLQRVPKDLQCCIVAVQRVISSAVMQVQIS